ncbi:MAG: GGDEF domain-containing protein [Actinomycetota bacterium]|nr:GGDEF domain-containing protein [Actinomycetota bacterium]
MATSRDVGRTSAPARVLAVLRRALARREDPYAGANLELVRRLGAVMLAVTAGLAAILLPLVPPTGHVGLSGWAIASAAFGVLALGAARMVKVRELNPDEALAWCYAAVAAITVLVWLTGGRDSPDYSLVLLWAGYMGASHPPRRVAIFLLAVVAAGLAPLAYAPASSAAAAGSLVRVTVWALLTVLANAWMQSVRNQRAQLMAGEIRAKGEARIDPLTQLGNRRGFDEALGRHIDLAQRTGAPLSIVVADLDDFKTINDRFGHLSGDQVLRAAAAALGRALRGHDESFRWGGDEFALILPQTDLTGAEVVCERVAREVGALRRPDDTPLFVACGRAQLVEGMSGRDLMDAADLALMSRKRAHRPAPAPTPLERDD